MNYEYNIGNLLKTKREHLGLSQRRLATIINVSNNTISKLEKGIIKEPTRNTIVKIEKFLNLDLEEYKNTKEKNDIKIKRTKENMIEFESKNMEYIIEFLKSFDFDIDELLPKIGDEISINIDNDSILDSENYYYFCPHCKLEICDISCISKH